MRSEPHQTIAAAKESGASELYLGNLKITTVPREIGQLTNISTLYLQGNNLTKLPPEIIQLANLSKLFLNGNPLTTLPQEVVQLTNLTKLNLGGCKLTMLPPEIGQLRKLTELDLSDNELTLLPPEIGQLSNLNELNLSNTKLTTLPLEITQLPSLTSLSLNYCNLTALIPEIEAMTYLVKLYLQGNQLTTIPSWIAKLKKLTVLGLHGNRFSTFPSEIVQLSNLTGLSLGGNKLTELPAEFGRLTNLSALDLSATGMTTFPLELLQLTNITSLGFNSNKLTTLPPDIGKITKLTDLDLRSNKLTELPPEIGQLSKLTKIQLDGNPIKGIQKMIIEEPEIMASFLKFMFPEKPPVTTFKIPTELRTAFKQYLAYFNDYMMATRGAEVGLEVRTVEDGLELEIRKQGGLSLDSIDEYLEDYLDFIKKNLDKLEVEFEVPTDPTDQKITMVELRGHVRHLRQTVETRNVRIELLERLVTDKDKYLTLFANKSDTVQVMVQAQAQATATATLSLEIPKLQGALDNLREEVDTPALKEAQDLLDKIPKGAEEEKLVEIGVMPKVKRLVEKGLSAETKLGKVVKSAESGFKNLQKVGRLYNAIAQMVGFPLVPRLLLEESYEKGTNNSAGSARGHCE